MAFLKTVAEDAQVTKISVGMSQPRDKAEREWLQDVAKRAKARWDKREEEPWCSYCGAPKPPFRCPCQQEKYCSAVHQRKNWRFHKRSCTNKTKKKASE